MHWPLGAWVVAQPRRVIPWGTLVANLIGGYLIGCVWPCSQAPAPSWTSAWRLALVTGFQGALTTFSSFLPKGGGHAATAALPAILGTAAAHLGSLLLTIVGLHNATF